MAKKKEKLIDKVITAIDGAIEALDKKEAEEKKPEEVEVEAISIEEDCEGFEEVA